jgi:predicted nuclease of restriction endonuclease-like RecB superfamily
MLTADLAQSWTRGGRTGPRTIDTDDPDYLRSASDLIQIFDTHAGRARHELDQALQEYVGTGTDYKILRGLIKLLMDRCEFETATTTDPIEIRRALFLKARAHHPVVNNDALRAEVVIEVARELGCAPDVVTGGLYADLPENQKLNEFETLNESELLDLYNVAQAQALLYRCVEMRLWIEPQSPEAYRELFGATKAYRLIHSIKGSAAAGYEIRLDGPVSMFHRSQKYGVQMAVFLPALLLCTGWRMRAEITQKPGSASAFFELDSRQKKLRSHYLSAVPYENPALEKFAESWTQHDSAWTLSYSSEVIDLGASVFIPDFALTHADGQQVYLEMLGFWTPQRLQEKLKEFAHVGFKNFLVAAWDDLRGSREPLARIPEHTIVFKRNLDPAIVELTVNKMIFGEPSEKL